MIKLTCFQLLSVPVAVGAKRHPGSETRGLCRAVLPAVPRGALPPRGADPASAPLPGAPGPRGLPLARGGKVPRGEGAPAPSSSAARGGSGCGVCGRLSAALQLCAPGGPWDGVGMRGFP